MTPRIMLYGRDSTLLWTRQMLLEQAQFEVCTTTEPAELHCALSSTPIQLLVLCHSIPEDEREAIRSLVHASNPGVKILVLDEVDRMLDMGFKPSIRRIAAALPADRQTLCYSATLSAEIRDVARDYLKDPVRIEIGSVLKPSPNVELRSFEVPTNKKQELLEHLLGTQPGSFLVFVRTKHGADRVARRLVRSGHAATQIHGDRSQSQRNAALRSFAQGHHRVLVATDVAARGIDVADVAHVVNYDMPKEAEDFVHRVGRTGRASARGIASTFAAPDETRDLRKMERTLAITPKQYRVKSIA